MPDTTSDRNDEELNPQHQLYASPPRTGHRKRGRYIGNACSACQKRKVKCPGGQPCRQCRAADTNCTYGHDGRKRKSKASASTSTTTKNGRSSTTTADVDASEHVENDSSIAVAMAPPSPGAGTRDSSMLIMHVLARLQHLESRIFPNDATSSDLYPQNLIQQECDEPRDVLPAIENSETISRYGASCLYQPVSVLDQTLGGAPASESLSTLFTTWHDQAPRHFHWSLDLLEQHMLQGNHQELRDAVDVFFELLNPHYPCVCENEFRPQFEAFLSSDPNYPWKSSDRYQFLALINLIAAESKALREDSTLSQAPPGWDEFCHAENILHRLSWLGKANLLTIQCLIVKARYLLYIEKGSGAYDTIGRATRLCVQLGLHNQASWTQCSAFEVVMRQRIFWTVFYLERHVSLNNGNPYQLRDSDIRVDLPANHDDKLLFPNQPLPPPGCVTSPCGSLSASVKWGRLAAELWDEVLGVHACKQGNEEFVVTLDARIKFAVEQLPPHLQWENIGKEDVRNFDYPFATVRQALILHLRMNQLRLLLRQEKMLSFTYDLETAVDCVAIATSSIEAMQFHRTSPVQSGVGRFATVLYLLSAILSLVCVVVKPDNQPQTRAVAIEAFKLGLSHLEQLSLTYQVACHSLIRIQRIVAAAKTFVDTVPSVEQNQPLADTMPPFDIQLTDLFSNDIEMTNVGTKDDPQHIINDILAFVNTCDPKDNTTSGWTLL